MIIVTGGAGFIGSAVIWKLNQMGRSDILVVDNFNTSEKWKNLVNLDFISCIDKDEFLNFVKNHDLLSLGEIDCIVHMGACSSTTEDDFGFLLKNNTQYTTFLTEYCIENNIKFINASSASTYGQGVNFSDSQDLRDLKPLCPYAYSKHLYDTFLLKRLRTDSAIDTKIASLKFFNAFGPNEYHKKEMSSMIFKMFQKMKNGKEIELFHQNNQSRDFIYIKDCANIIYWFITNEFQSGIYNVGSGNTTTWEEVTEIVHKYYLRNQNKLEFLLIKRIPMPGKIKKQYQFFTKADMSKLNSYFNYQCMSIDEAICDYVENYLIPGNLYL